MQLHLTVYVYYVGKPRDPHANALAAEYLKRTRRFLPCEMQEVRPGRFNVASRHTSATKVLLDVAGRPFDSAAFTALIAERQMAGRDLVFLIGGADGPPPDWQAHADLRLSLSAMTFPHEFARVMLAEQIYRAATTLRGHPYPR